MTLRVRIEESDPARLRALAREWGVKAVEGQHEAVIAVAIADAYRRMIEKERRDNERDG